MTMQTERFAANPTMTIHFELALRHTWQRIY